MMIKKNAFLLNGVVLCGVMLGNTSPVFANDELDRMPFQGNGSRIIDTGRPSAMLPVSIMTENISGQANTTSSATYTKNNISAMATTSDYEFSGSVAASGFSNAWYSGGYFHDEISFLPADSGIYAIDLIFNVAANTQLYSQDGRTDLAMTLSYWDGSSYTATDTNHLLSASGSNITPSVSGEYHLSLTGINHTSLNSSENEILLPYTIGLWGNAVNGEISWNNIMLTDIVVTNESGATLDPQFYSLRSNSLVFNDVVASAVVPLPGAFWLLGPALAGLAALRRRESRRLSKNDTERDSFLQNNLAAN